MRSLLHLLLLSLAPLWCSTTSAFFFPNITSLPPAVSLPENVTSSAWDVFRSFAGCQTGEKRAGLAKLKKYLYYFGYIPDSPPSSNFTDDFDDALRSAIKTYQRNFNLNPTGDLDDATLKKLLMPRCGNPDIVNGTTGMNSGKPSSSGATNTSGLFHSVAHYEFFPGTPRWPPSKRSLTYAFLPENQLPDEAKDVFSRAFARWSAVTQMNFSQSDSYADADIHIGFYTGDHGDGEPFDGRLGTLAHAFSPPNGRFHLDGDEEWVATGDVTKSSLSSAIDLESVAVHEIGHLLGLGHSSVEEAIMYPTISSKMRKVDLATDDIQGIQQLYGSNPNYNGSSTATTSQERESSGAGSRHLTSRPPFAAAGVIATVGLALFLSL